MRRKEPNRCLRSNSIGLIELSSVATGFLVEDTMLKAGNIQLLMARSICSGKFLIVVSGDVTIGAGGIGGRRRPLRGIVDRAAPDCARASFGSAGDFATVDIDAAVALDRRDRDIFSGEHHRSR